MILLVITKRISFVEISLKYYRRIDESAVTGSFYNTFNLGITMIAFVLKTWFVNLTRLNHI